MYVYDSMLYMYVHLVYLLFVKVDETIQQSTYSMYHNCTHHALHNVICVPAAVYSIYMHVYMYIHVHP